MSWGDGHNSVAGNRSGWEAPMPDSLDTWTSFHLWKEIAATEKGCVGWTVNLALCTRLPGAVDPQATGRVGQYWGGHHLTLRTPAGYQSLPAQSPTVVCGPRHC